jgi:hypothetical protein
MKIKGNDIVAGQSGNGHRCPARLACQPHNKQPLRGWQARRAGAVVKRKKKNKTEKENRKRKSKVKRKVKVKRKDQKIKYG